MFNLTFFYFNLFEGIFWFLYALACIAGMRYVLFLSKRFWHFLFIDFLLFGISDILEAVYSVNLFSYGGAWLLIWKILCITGFMVSLIWYIAVRFKTRNS
jgi:hypothetical protein